MVDKIRNRWRIISWRTVCLLGALLLHAWAFSSPLAIIDSKAPSYQHHRTAVSLTFVTPSVKQAAVHDPNASNKMKPVIKQSATSKTARTAQKIKPAKKIKPQPIAQTDNAAEPENYSKKLSNPKAVSTKAHEKDAPKEQLLAAAPSSLRQTQHKGVHNEPVISEPLFEHPPLPPKYPTVARKRGQQGTVWLEIWLDQWGKQSRLDVMQSSGIQVLDQAALQAVSSWDFQPHRVNGQGIASRVRIPVEFALN